MKGLFLSLFIALIICYTIKPQSSVEEEINHTVQNAKKGIYWALSNIPENKTKIDNQLISDDKLIAEVKLYKEIEGVRIESTGYHNTYSVKIVFYRSDESLAADGFIKPKTEKEITEE